MKLERNPDYWDAPRPYLDSLELRAVSDANQRVNMMVSGGADLASESSWAALAKADQAGLVTDAVPVGGGQYLVMNTRRAPFDDPRAREAVSAAVNLDDINTAVFEGHGEVPDTLFPESSPFHADIPLRQDDPERAQQLFDELAAEGKPVEFTFTATSLVEIRSVAESLQAQLAAYDNVDVQVEVLDIAGYMPRTAARDFDMIIWAADSPEPDTTLWNAFHSTSSGNHTGISDPELDAALDAGRTGTSGEERVAAYRTVQERLAELEPGIWYIRSAPSVISSQNLHACRFTRSDLHCPTGCGSLLRSFLPRGKVSSTCRGSRVRTNEPARQEESQTIPSRMLIGHTTSRVAAGSPHSSVRSAAKESRTSDLPASTTFRTADHVEI